MSNTKKKMTLLELGETCMAQAMLIFLFADLRILSATGQIQSKYEHLCIDSDRSPRFSAQDFAGFAEYNETRGVTAAHIMAILLLEITREADEVAASKQPKSIVFDSTDKTKNAPFRLKKKDLQAAQGLPTLLHCYSEMVETDISESVHHVRKQEYPMDAEIPSSKAFHRADFDPDVEDEDDEVMFNNFMKKSKAALGRQADFKRITELQKMATLQNSMMAKHASFRGNLEGYYDEEEIVQLVEQSIENRDNDRLLFMKNFFKEDSISRVLVESKAEMVWLSDWHTTHECTYAISIDREENKVLLVFRGAYTSSDWKHATDSRGTATSNPIKEEYPHRPKTLRLHRGFWKYLFRVRKDTATTKYDEIASKLAHYCNLVGESFSVTVCGHSLGAALATVFAFYASTEERFTCNGAIETVTFGAPFVGGHKFSEAVRHQEDTGKLRIAKFRVVGDGVAYLPPTLLTMGKRGAWWFHSGMNVTLPSIRTGPFKVFGQPQPKVTYNGPSKSFVGSYLRQVREFYFWQIPVRFWLAVKMHTLVEHKKRMSVINSAKDYGNSPLVKYSLEELYEMRDELK
eukprot:CAMPEP_0119010666 /NCGR_PEP_ID=MMETSP1176-20130426/5167_1 /TAXON_ID=265551 /ORGANISM="Synedropsis recta cf, Strain CCMP1620" /LENGTH=573 /DNA_ID=CAMNT_0006963373 /DNA_START=87 /DNA_END=1808 /DNA_ORIENTATION=+